MTKVTKAGFLPYMMGTEEPIFMFMISSDPYYGGDKPMISKGEIDGNESYPTAALREAHEELGLKESNLLSCEIGWEGKVVGLCNSYGMIIYTGQVNNYHDFDTPHFETERTVWLTLDEFKEQGRESHIPIVEIGRAHV